MRSTGAPAYETATLDGYATDATILIANGDAAGNKRVTSGTVLVDGLEVVHPSDFGEKIGSISVPITLRNHSTISVRLAGAPGDHLTMSVDGHLATTAVVASGGGAVALLGGQVALTVPASAVSGSIDVTAMPVLAPSVEAVPGTTIDMGPNGTVFTSPVTLSIAFDPAALPRNARPASFRMYWWDATHWEALTGNSVDLVRGIVSAQTTHFTVYSLLPTEVVFCPGDAGAENDLQTAIGHVPVGGTILVCDGTHTVNPVVIDKPLTLRSLNRGGATLADADPAGTFQVGTPIIRINGITSGVVRIADIGMAVTDQGIRPWGVYDQVEIDSVRFTGVVAGNAVAVRADTTSVSTARVNVERSSFSQLQLGVWPVSRIETNVRHSQFDRFTGGGVVYSSAGSAATQSFGYTEDNQFTNCGSAGCIRVLTTGAVVIARNHLEALDQSVVLGAITIQGAGSWPNAVPTIVEDNVIVSHATAAPANTAAGWMFQSGVYVSDPNVRTHLVRRNHITDAYAGLATSSTDVAATDNSITGGVLAFNHSGPRILTFQRNDLTGQSGSFVAPAFGGNYRCNWWGSAAGPTAPPASVAVLNYTPWATAPIAGTNTACDVGVVYTTIRVCPTPNASGLPTVPTLSQALATVPTGGTILVCDGTFAVNSVSILKPVTITAEGPGTPTLDAGSGARTLLIQGVQAGSVTIAGLRFIGATLQQIMVGSSVGTAIIANNEFHPRQTAPYGVDPRGTVAGVSAGGVGIGTVNIDHNTFIGGDQGIATQQVPGATVNITGNSFSGQVNGAVQLNGTVPATHNIENNSFEDCSDRWCVGIFHHARVVNNTFRVNIGRPLNYGILVQVLNGDLTPSVITDNTITGYGNNPTPRSDGTTFPVRSMGIYVLGAVAEVSRNRITNVFNGLGVRDGASVTAIDNVIQTTYAPIAGVTPSTLPGLANVLTANWNDFSDFVGAVNASITYDVSGFNLRCNWWGQAAGPTSSMNSNIPVGVYTPFSLSPVAGLSHAGCTP